MDRVPAGHELSFRVGFTGHSGHLRIEPLPPVERPNPLHSLPDFILPPAFPPETPDSIREYIKEKYLLPRLDHEEFSPEKTGKQWEFDWFDKAKFHLEPSLPRSIIVPKWELPFRRTKSKDELGRWEPVSEQVDVSELTVGAEGSDALPRIVGPAKDYVRGSISNRPFHPGGLDDSHSIRRVLPDGASSGEWLLEVLNGGPAQVVPPGFKDGLDLGDLKAHSFTWNVYEDHKESSARSTSNKQMTELSVQFDDLFKKAWEEDIAEPTQDGLSNLQIDIPFSCTLVF